MNMNPTTGRFIDGQLHKIVRRNTRRNRMFVYMWAWAPDRRPMLHKGGKP